MKVAGHPGSPLSFESIDELELRRVLKKKPSAADLLRHLVKHLMNPAKTWEEKRVLWLFLYRWGKEGTLIHAMIEVLGSKGRIPFDVLIEITSAARVRPKKSALESLLKGIRKQEATDELISARGWDKWDKRFNLIRKEILDRRIGETRKAKENMLEKFNFLRNQRLVEQAGRVLRRMIEIYPQDPQLKKLKAEFDEQWARDILSSHLANLSSEKFDRTLTEISRQDDEMMTSFVAEGKKLARTNPSIATDLAVACLFMSEYKRGLEILELAPETVANEWLRVELLFHARRFVETMDLLNNLEIKYVDDPETAFAVSYLRARCFRELGQQDAALEILQSIVRVRPHYRSAHALIQEWTEGASWE